MGGRLTQRLSTEINGFSVYFLSLAFQHWCRVPQQVNAKRIVLEKGYSIIKLRP